MKTWFKNHLYSKEIFSCTWRFSEEYKLYGEPVIEFKECNNFSEIDVWEKIYYEPGGVGVYRSHSPDSKHLIIVHELFLELPQSIEFYRIEEDFTSIITRLDSIGISVIDRI